MKTYEYQARDLLETYGITVPRALVVRSPKEAAEAVAPLDGQAVIKAQVLTGGRGKAGGIRLVDSVEQAQSAAREILAMHIKGMPVKCVMVAEKLEIRSEYYAGITVDRDSKSVILILSTAGGMNIEEAAVKEPQSVHRFTMSNTGLVGGSLKVEGFGDGRCGENHPQAALEAATQPTDQGSKAALAEWLSELFTDKAILDQAVETIQNMHRLFREKDCSLVEINPLVVTAEDRLIAADAKIVFDDSGVPRHPEIAELRNREEYTPEELQAKAAGLSFVSLDGEIGCMVNGAGLAMATMDGIKLAGGTAANFLDVGGSSDPQKVVNAMRILLKNEKLKVILVNIFGGITRCDDIAKGILTARKQLDIQVPLVIRLVGTNEEEALRMLRKAGMIVTRSMTEAIRNAVTCANGGTAS